ncbi:MAG TPA: sulfatase [Candidatus Brocadiia bacterium]|nr:sulfatase [Candidatus Brocadiia bacterium]
MATSFNRRDFLGMLAGGAAAMATTSPVEPGQVQKPNLLLITADDMDYNSVGVCGCQVPDITPNIDRLASEGMRFEHAHVTIAVCQPCRQSLMTGRYPHNYGSLGFEPINPTCPTLQEQLREAGYLNGIMGKVAHCSPQSKFCWDFVIDAPELGEGRDPKLYYAGLTAFLSKARTEGKPFFLMVNSHDPHRPFPGSEQEREAESNGRKSAKFPKASRYYKPAEAEVPGFLPDIPDVRKEVAQYFTAVHRCDETVGQVLRALGESGFAGNTLVFFLSDNGMSFPFAKTNCYRASTRTPLIIRWPGRIEPGRIESDQMVCGIDFMPTVLDALGLKQVKDMDGRSYLPVLEGGKQDGRDSVFTVFYRTSANRDYFMRAIENKRYMYIYNPWSDGKEVFKNEPQSGLSFSAMKRAAQTDKEIAERIKLFLCRVKEEFYDYEQDPFALKNLIASPEHEERIVEMRMMMRSAMIHVKDPVLLEFENFIGTMSH